MIAGDRIIRLVRNIVGDGTCGGVQKTDPTELPYPVELDLEDRATVLRLWSGEVDEITGALAAGSKAEAIELLRRVVMDHPQACSARFTCSCSYAEARRFLSARGVPLPVDEEEPF